MASTSGQSRSSIIERLTASPRPKCQSCEDVSLSSIAYCFVCNLFYCENCWKHHQGIPPSRNHQSITLEQALTEREERNILTKDSSSCVMEIVQAVTSQEAVANSEFIAAAYEGFTKNVDKLQQVMTKGQEMEEKVKRCRSEVDEEIKKAFSKIRQELDNRERTLLNEISHSAVKKSKRLSLQYKELSQLKMAMEDCHKLARAAKSRDDWSEVDIEAEHLLAKFSEISLDLCENANIAVEINADHVMGELESFGYVATGASPSKSTVTGLPSKLVVGREVSVRVHTRNASGEEIGHGGEVVRGMLTKKGKVKSKVMATSHDVGDGTYLLSVKPKEEGEHLLSVTLHGQHVQKSPFTAIVSNSDYYYKSLKKPVQTITGINRPYYIAFHASGDMFVTSCGDGCVYVYDTNGRRKATIGKQGTGDMEFNGPNGIAISGDTVYVADQSNHRVQSFTTSGKFLSKFGSRGSGQGQFQYPVGLSVSGDNLIYVSDNGNSRIQVFHLDGKFCSSIDGNVPGEAAFKYPCGVAIAPGGNVHVVGNSSYNAVVFSPEGKFVRSLELKGPEGIAVDSTGYSIATEYSAGRVKFFDLHGNLIHTLEGLTCPIGVQVSKDGSVWVAEESPANRLSKFHC